MILTDREIQIALQHALITIEPMPDSSAYSSTSVDLTLDEPLNEFTESTNGLDRCVDPSSAGFGIDAVLKDVTREVRIDAVRGYDFQPGALILAWTREYVKLQPYARIAARVEGKSSLARLGIGVHITAPTIHSGFEGQIRLEMINHGRIPVRLKPGMRICQLILEQTVGTPVSAYKGRFSGQTADRTD
jgi:dCTP deaminase